MGTLVVASSASVEAEVERATVGMLEPVAHRSLPETVLVELRRAIVNGMLAPAQRLVETELAAQMHVSRATVRQALRRLEVEGLVEVRPRRGAVVARMSTAEALAVCQARGVLEGFAARTACRELMEADLQRMRRTAASMGEAVAARDVLRLAELDVDFHTVIVAAGHNQRLAQMWSTLNAQMGALLMARLSDLHPSAHHIMDLHEELRAVLARQDPDAAEAAVREHYFGTRSPYGDADHVSGFKFHVSGEPSG